MIKNYIRLSSEARTYVEDTQLYFRTEIGSPRTRAQILDGIVIAHANLTDLLGVDAGLFAAALESLSAKGGAYVTAQWLKALGDETGHWTTGVPSPGSIRPSCFASPLPEESADPKTQDRD